MTISRQISKIPYRENHSGVEHTSEILLPFSVTDCCTSASPNERAFNQKFLQRNYE